MRSHVIWHPAQLHSHVHEEEKLIAGLNWQRMHIDAGQDGEEWLGARESSHSQNR